jgi:hypothetical protein
MHFAFGGLLAGLLAAPNALAFCRTTTCNPSNPTEQCQLDANRCVTTGIPLGWRSSCVTVGVQQMGSPRHGFGYDVVAGVVEQAFGAWMQADCGQGKPSIDVKLIGPVECGVSEYNSKAGNANIVLFRENDWPYPGAANALALTTTRFDTKTGDLWDADIELNDVSTNFSIGDPIKGDDLLSVLTHEAGHFLGLSHSPIPDATMKAIYNPSTDGASFRSLAPDDMSGICTIYPPDRKPATTSCENRHGFSGQCGADQPPPADQSKGCSLSARAPVSGGPRGSYVSLLSLLAAVCGARLARRRRTV